MQNFQEFAQEALLEISKNSSLPITDLFGSGNLDTAVSNLIDKYKKYLEDIKESIEKNITNHKTEITNLKIAKEEFDSKPLKDQIEILKTELNTTKEIIEKLSASLILETQRAAKVIEEHKEAKSTGLKKEAENAIKQIADIALKTNTTILKGHIDYTKTIVDANSDDGVFNHLVQLKSEKLLKEISSIEHQKELLEKNLVNVIELINSLQT